MLMFVARTTFRRGRPLCLASVFRDIVALWLGNYAIMFCCPVYPSPASTKTPTGALLSQLTVTSWTLVVPAFAGHPAPLGTRF